MRASSPTNARPARSEAERAERGSVQMRPCTPTRSEPPPRDGSIDLAEDPSVPEGQPKSEQAPIRRPPCARRAAAPECAQAPFSFGPCTARFLFGQDRKENGGCIPAGQAPCGSRHPRGRRPAAHISPSGRLPPLRSPHGSGGNPAGGHTGPPLPFPADQLIQRQIVEVRQGNERRQGRFPQTQLIVLIGAPTDPNFRRKSLLAQVPCGSQLKKMFRKCHGHPLFS